MLHPHRSSIEVGRVMKKVRMGKERRGRLRPLYKQPNRKCQSKCLMIKQTFAIKISLVIN